MRRDLIGTLFIWLEKIGTNNRLAICRVCLTYEADLDVDTHPSIKAQKMGAGIQKVAKSKPDIFLPYLGRRGRLLANGH